MKLLINIILVLISFVIIAILLVSNGIKISNLAFWAILLNAATIRYISYSCGYSYGKMSRDKSL